MKNSKDKFLTYFSVTILLIAFLYKANAQSFELGLRFMPTFSSFELQTSSGGTVKGEATLGYGGGLFLGFNFSDYIGIQAEVIYNEASQKYSEVDVERKVDLKYVNIPLLLSLNTGKSKGVNFNIVAGPQIGLSVGSDLFTSNDENAPKAVLSVKKGDLGFAYGAGLDFALNTGRTIRLGLGYRGVAGLFDISDNNDAITTDSYYVLDRTHIRTHSAYIGLSILF